MSLKVLIVDDAQVDRNNLERILTAAGHRVLVAESGEQGVARAKNDKPDVILMDVNMPDLDGFAATRQLKGDPATRDIPVVFVPGKNQKADIAWGHMLGARGYVGKPYSPDQILAQLAGLTDMDAITSPAMLPPTLALTRAFVHPAASAATPGMTRSAGDHQVRQGFRVGQLALMVRYEDGSELTQMPTVFRLPNTPAWLLGIANLHGLLVPVFDLGAWTGVKVSPDARRMLLVLSHGPDAAGVVIDGLPQRLRWTETQQADAATAPARLASHVRGAALIEGVLWFDLDRSALLDALEHAMHTNT